MRRLFFILAFALTTACATPTPRVDLSNTPPTSNPRGALTVYAAASLTGAFTELGAAFERAHPGTRVEFNFAGSQELVTQLAQGAHADVFASADLKNMDALQKQALVADTPQVFARNKLVVITPQDNPAGIHALQDLAKPGIKLVVANQSVPVGNYTLQVLAKLAADANYGAGFQDAVLQNVVSQENNVKQVASKISLGEGDAGVVYSTDAQTAADRVRILDVPDAFNVLALYPLATVKGAGNPSLAHEWIAFVLSPPSQAVLNKYGFLPPG
ncbi:MAG: molybdate ABC transporter substrate-binding protein [Chloroflexi bacterium]|nr:molybdate ABC transporter substrate-binding protein [Chloroflexota bacterium]